MTAQPTSQFEQPRAHAGLDLNTIPGTPTRAPVPDVFFISDLRRCGVVEHGVAPIWVGLTSVMIFLASCSSAADKADRRYAFVFDHGTNRDVCDEARRRKSAYVDANRYDRQVWAEQDIYCAAAETRGGEPANTQGEDYKRYKQIESDVNNEAEASYNAAMSNTSAEVARSARVARQDQNVAGAASEADADDVPVCDRPDSPAKRALMNEVGTDCLGE